MSKSTPISQLPLNTDILDEDDAAVREVQEVLNQISQAMPPVEAPSSPKPQHHQQSPSKPASANQPQTIYYPLPASYEAAPPTHHQPSQPPAAPQPAASSPWDGYAHLTPDIRSAVLVVIACALVQVLPIEVFVARFIPAISNISHGHVVVKALCAGLIFFLATRYV